LQLPIPAAESAQFIVGPSMLSALDPSVLAPVLAGLCVLAASLGLPVPTMPALIYAGSVAATSSQPATIVAASFAGAFAGGLAGDTVWFFAGRFYGFRVLRLLCRVSLSRDTCVRRTESFFSRSGVRILLIARFVPGLSVVSVPMSGTARTSFSRFVVHDAIGVALWIGCGLLLGHWFADQVDALLLVLQQFGLGIGGAALLIVLGFAAWRWSRRRRLLRDLEVSRVSVRELYELMAAETGPVIIDVRSAESRQHDPFLIPGSMLLDLGALEQAMAGIDRKRCIVVYCACPNEISAALIAKQLRKLGFDDVRPLLGGLDAWREQGRELHPLQPATMA
jgi:membrane protein DedA with SNARE-associated domain/rhodanese-related sulfurtransferase